jgi:hypothetical protein
MDKTIDPATLASTQIRRSYAVAGATGLEPATSGVNRPRRRSRRLTRRLVLVWTTADHMGRSFRAFYDELFG